MPRAACRFLCSGSPVGLLHPGLQEPGAKMSAASLQSGIGSANGLLSRWLERKPLLSPPSVPNPSSAPPPLRRRGGGRQERWTQRPDLRSCPCPTLAGDLPLLSDSLISSDKWGLRKPAAWFRRGNPYPGALPRLDRINREWDHQHEQ